MLLSKRRRKVFFTGPIRSYRQGKLVVLQQMWPFGFLAITVCHIFWSIWPPPNRCAKNTRGTWYKDGFVEKNVPNPSYTAVIDKSGELIIGAAQMECYGSIVAEDIVSLLPEKPQTVIIDANFPRETLLAISKSLPEKTNLYALGTSVEKVSRLLPLLNRVDVVVLNKAEACSLTSSNNDVSILASKISNKLQRRSAIALVSDGANEAALAENCIMRRSPPKIRLGTPMVQGMRWLLPFS